ncbi:alpha/beta hydrolase [Synechococcus sp. LTW-R]|uniref:alpha/beta hydrolase n=1 Tax=Synechococcus sp. LTW-R TaxID=2751170 RepID=UPI0016273757|nr:alpha/beta hydrolase [Synechococcus sp. LTW-R]QNG28653.1 alpha/beta hydrolase [Synechococcus sp. LTW-R]
MRKALLPLAGVGFLMAGLSAQAIPQNGPTTINSDQSGVGFGAPTFIQPSGLPTQTARTVSNGFVRSNTLLPLGGNEVIDNPVPRNLSDLSGWSHEQLQAGLQQEYSVDVAAVARFLYSPKGEQFLKESIQENNYTPFYSQQNSLQAVRSAIILDSADGKLSSYGMMKQLPTDQRLQGSMKVCDVNSIENSQQATSLLSWYMNTPACIAAYTAEAPEPVKQPVRGLW